MDLIAQLEAEQVAALGKDIPDFKAGDTIRVGYKVTEGSRSRVQNYEGVCISRKNGSGIAGSFTVRKISFGEGVERAPTSTASPWFAVVACVVPNCTTCVHVVVNPHVSQKSPTISPKKR